VMMCAEKHLRLPRGWVSPGEPYCTEGKVLLVVRWVLERGALWILGHQDLFIMYIFNGELGKREEMGKLFLNPVDAWSFF